MSRAREFADLAGSADAGGLTGRNRVINGDFQIWQRGTSQTTAGYGSADRWRLNVSGATLTGSQGTFTDGQTAVPGNPRFYLALDVTTGNDNAGWFHRLEGTHEFANDVYTLSFWAKSATPRAMTVGANSYDSSADTFDETHTVSPSTFTPTSSWQKFTFKVTFSNMSTLGSFASGDFTAFFITQGSDTSTAAWKLDLALVQFEKGDKATPFEHRSFGEELQRCQRFFTRVPTIDGSTAYAFLATGMATDTTAVDIPISFPVTMRANPTLTTSGSMRVYNGGTVNPSAGITLNSATNYAATVRVPTGSVLTTKDAILVGLNNDVDANFQFSAEL